MAFVLNRSGKRWTLCFRDSDGEPRRQPSKARTKTEAQRLADELERKHERVRLGLEEGIDLKMTLADVVADYRKDVIPTFSVPTAPESQLNKHILPALGALPLHRIRPADIERMLAGTKEKLSDATREKLRIRVQALFEYARTRLKVFKGENPAKLVPKIKVPIRAPRFLERDQVVRILASAEEPNLLATAFYTGLRKGELCGLLREDVDLARGILNVRFSYGKIPKNGRERMVGIPPELVPYLRNALEESASKWLFPGQDGKMRPKTWYGARAFRVALKAAKLLEGFDHICRRKGCGFRERRKDDAVSQCPECEFVLWPVAVPLDFTLKHARSTYGTQLYRATGDIRAVQESLGHQDIAVTMAHYSNALLGRRLEQTQLLSFAPVSGLALANTEPAHSNPAPAESATVETQPNQEDTK